MRRRPVVVGREQVELREMTGAAARARREVLVKAPRSFLDHCSERPPSSSLPSWPVPHGLGAGGKRGRRTPGSARVGRCSGSPRSCSRCSRLDRRALPGSPRSPPRCRSDRAPAASCYAKVSKLLGSFTDGQQIPTHFRVPGKSPSCRVPTNHCDWFSLDVLGWPLPWHLCTPGYLGCPRLFFCDPLAFLY